MSKSFSSQEVREVVPASSRTAKPIFENILFMLGQNLEFKSDVQECVERVGVVVLRVLGEHVGSFVSGAVVVVAVLLVASGFHVAVVGEVLHLEVDAEALSFFHADVFTDGKVEHPASFAFFLFCCSCGEDVSFCIEGDATVVFHVLAFDEGDEVFFRADHRR